jgi:hypothetical protein
MAQHNIDYGQCSPARYQMQVVNQAPQDVQITLDTTLVYGTGWNIACSVPSFTFPMSAYEVPRYVEFFLTPTETASDSAVLNVDVVGSTTCGPQPMGGTRLVVLRSYFLDVPSSARPWSLAFSPNPFSDMLSIHLQSPRRDRVGVEIFDVAGRLVRRLGEADVPAGATVIQWDGRITGGSRARSGLYLVRVKTANRTVTHRVAFLR